MELSAAELTIFWALLAVCCLMAAYRVRRLILAVKQGRPMEIEPRAWPRVRDVLVHVLGQKGNLRNHRSGDLTALGHLFIFWGAGIFAVYFMVFVLAGTGLGWGGALRSWPLAWYFLWLTDLAGLLLLAALGAAAARRVRKRPERLGPHFDAGVFLALCGGGLVLLLCHYFYEAVILLQVQPAVSPPVTLAFAKLIAWLMPQPAGQAALGQAAFWGQALLGMGLVVYAPFSHHKHPLFSPAAVYLRSRRPSGAMRPIDFARDEPFGAARAADFDQRQLLGTLACTHCGRCGEVCPAQLSGKEFSPKGLLLELSQALLYRGGPSGEGEFCYSGGAEGLWSCTTCGACVEVCPVFNRPLDCVLELRRGLIYDCRLEEGHQSALERVSRDFNPWGIKWDKRMRSLNLPLAREGEKYDCLYWVGCAASCDDTAADIARAMERVLTAAGLSFAVLGADEKCCGDFARRVGDEGLYQKLARENIETLQRFDFDFILTHCPHCFNTLANEYPDFGGDFEVVHHASLINRLIEQKAISLHSCEGKVIFHDPCYLGRHNGVYEPPREVLGGIFGDLREFPRAREAAFCCGAGGGHMWKQEEAGEKISLLRMEEALAQRPDQLATACPFCLLMFQEARQMSRGGDELQVLDLAQIVERQLV